MMIKWFLFLKKLIADVKWIRCFWNENLFCGWSENKNWLIRCLIACMCVQLSQQECIVQNFINVLACVLCENASISSWKITDASTKENRLCTFLFTSLLSAFNSFEQCNCAKARGSEKRKCTFIRFPMPEDEEKQILHRIQIGENFYFRNTNLLWFGNGRQTRSEMSERKNSHSHMHTCRLHPHTEKDTHTHGQNIHRHLMVSVHICGNLRIERSPRVAYTHRMCAKWEILRSIAFVVPYTPKIFSNIFAVERCVRVWVSLCFLFNMFANM